MAHDRSAHLARRFAVPSERSGPVFMGPRLRGDDGGYPLDPPGAAFQDGDAGEAV